MLSRPFYFDCNLHSLVKWAMTTIRFRCALMREVGRSRYAKGELFFTGEAISTEKSAHSSKFIPRQPFLATAYWSSCLVGPGPIGAGDARSASPSGQNSHVCPFASCFPHPSREVYRIPPRSAWNHNLRLAYSVAKTPLGTHSSYFSRSRVCSQVMAFLFLACQEENDHKFLFQIGLRSKKNARRVLSKTS